MKWMGLINVEKQLLLEPLNFLPICFSSMLNIAPSNSLVDKLTSISDLNDLLVLNDKVSELSTSPYRINISISYNKNICVVFIWYGEINEMKWN